MILICISLISDVKYLFHVPISNQYVWKNVRVLCPFLIELFAFLIFSCV